MPQEFINHHSLELMKAALPYMHPRMQKSVEVMSKAEELMSMVQTPGPSSDLSAMSFQATAPASIEDVLLQIKSVGTKREQEMIDNMTNILRMQKMMQSYRSFMNMKKLSSPGNTSPTGSSSQDTMMEFLLSQLTPDQKSNFENISIVLNAMNS